jgi:SagB-type dehydrogenase family enzyme
MSDPAGRGVRVGAEFQRLTKEPMGGGRDDGAWHELTVPHKDVGGVAAPVLLPPPQTSQGPPLWETIRARASRRLYQRDEIGLGAVSQLLWAGRGIRDERSNILLRTTPSGGGCYPIESYLCVHNVCSVEPGLYYHDLSRHALIPVKLGDLRSRIAAATHGQKICASAAVVFIWTAVVERSTSLCGERAYRYLYIEAGHIAQNTAIAAVALGLGSCQIGGFCDDALSDMLQLDGEHEPVVYLTAVGIPRRSI